MALMKIQSLSQWVFAMFIPQRGVGGSYIIKIHEAAALGLVPNRCLVHVNLLPSPTGT